MVYDPKHNACGNVMLNLPKLFLPSLQLVTLATLT